MFQTLMIPQKGTTTLWVHAVIGGVMLILFLSLGLWGYMKAEKVDGLKETIKVLEAQIVALGADNANLSSAIEEQNKGLQTLLYASEAASQAALLEVKQIEARAAKWESQYRKLLHRPQTEAPECGQVADLVFDYVVVRKEEAGS